MSKQLRGNQPQAWRPDPLGGGHVALCWCIVLILNACVDRGEAAFGEDCDSNDDCSSGMCPNGRCTQSCSETSPCPGNETCGSDGACILNPPPIDGTMQVGFLYVGPVGDHGWTKSHDDGRLFLQSHLDDIVTAASQSINPDDAPTEIDAFVARGDQVIVGTSFSFLNPLQAKAAAYPEVRFLTCSGFVTGPNLGSYFGRMYQVKYLLGVIAGQVTKTNTIGIVGSVCFPETIRHLNALTRGVRAVNPQAQVKVKWIFDWFSVDEEGPATRELIDAGADIIIGFTDTTIPLETVRDFRDNPPPDWPEDAPPVYSMGYDNPDSCNFGGSYCITSAYWNWGPILVRQLQAMREGTWNPADIIWEPIKGVREESLVHYAPINPEIVSQTVIDEVAQLAATMAQDTPEARMYPFAGPVIDSLGTQRFGEGELPTDEDLLSMCWYVEGASDTDDRPNEVPPSPYCLCDHGA